MSEQRDIYERLRALQKGERVFSMSYKSACKEGADEIANLRAQLAIASEHIAEMTDQLEASRNQLDKVQAEAKRWREGYDEMKALAHTAITLTNTDDLSDRKDTP